MHHYQNKRDNPGDFFPMPKAAFRLGLDSGEIAVLAFLMYCEDRKTYQCHPSYSTIGSAVGMSNNTVKKYVDRLERKGFILTEPTKIVIQPPKTKNSIRTVVLPPYMVTILADMKKSKTCEWIFPSPVKQGEPRNPTAIHRRFKLILERSGCKNIRFHDLRHTFATMALESGMDVKTLSDMIGHISAETTLNIYSHITDTMRAQASVKIDRKIGGTDAQVPEAKEEPRQVETSTVDENFEPYTPKIRKSGTGCVYQINDSLWEGSFYPRLTDGKRKKFNVYAKTREECEEKLAKMIAEKKAEVAELKKKAKTA